MSVPERDLVDDVGVATRLFAARDGRTLAYHCAGSGPRLVMLAGGPGLDPAAYFAHASVPGHEQIYLSPRGTGASDPPTDPAAYRVDDYVCDLEDLRDHLGGGLHALYAGGHGVSVALAYARARPGSVQRMVLANGPARFDLGYQAQLLVAQRRFACRASNGARRLQLATTAEEDLDHANDEVARHTAYALLLQARVACPTVSSTTFLTRLATAPVRPEPIAAMYDELVGGLDLLAGASRLETPTLVLAGGLDATVPAEHMRLIADTLPNAGFVLFQDAGHFVELEAQAAWDRVVGDFLGRQVPGRSGR